MLAPGGAAVRGWLRLLPWLLLLAGIGASGWWRYYLAPRHLPYLWFGAIVVIAVFLASELDGILARQRQRIAALRSHTPLGQGVRPAGLADWLELGVHWLPLLLLAALGPTTLSLSGGAPAARQLSQLRAASPARTAVPHTSAQPAAPLAPRPPDPAPAAAGQADAAPSAQYQATDLSQLYLDLDTAPGTPVELIGRLHHVQGNDEIVPVGVDPATVACVVYRYVIWCCVADAVPATALLDGPGAEALPDEGWVKVRGKLYRTGESGDIPQLRIASIEAIPEPDDPYLYISADQL